MTRHVGTSMAVFQVFFWIFFPNIFPAVLLRFFQAVFLSFSRKMDQNYIYFIVHNNCSSHWLGQRSLAPICVQLQHIFSFKHLWPHINWGYKLCSPKRHGATEEDKQIRDAPQGTCSASLILVEPPNKLYIRNGNRFTQSTRWRLFKTKEHPALQH